MKKTFTILLVLLVLAWAWFVYISTRKIDTPTVQNVVLPEKVSYELIDEKNIFITGESKKISLTDGYIKSALDWAEYIRFGPMSTLNFGPLETQEIEPYHIYQLELTDLETAKEVMDSLSYNPTAVVEKINNSTVVKWIEWWMCEARILELIGTKTNIRFTSDGCQTDEATDFAYFTKIIENIKE